MLVILVIALVVLGPERLPRAARQLGAAWRELTRLRDQVGEEVRSAIPDVDLPRIAPGAVSGFLRGLTSPTPVPAGARDDDTEVDGGAGEPVPADVGAHDLLRDPPFRYAERSAGYPPAGPPAGPGRSIGSPAAVPSFAPDDPGMN